MPVSQSPSIARQYVRYAIPSVTGMVVTSLYTVVDGIFVGRGVGDMALAAVNIVYPFIMLQIAVAMLLAIGGANLYSMRHGSGHTAEANDAFCQSFWLLAGASVVINLLAIVFAAPLCRLMGADAELLPMAREYLFWTALFGVLYMPGLGLSIFVRNDGAPKREMAGTISGALTNIVLDAAFILGFGWGVAGAAIATGIGQMVSVAVFASHLIQKKGALRLRRPQFRKTEVGKLLYNGFASFLMEFSQSAITLSFNTALMAHTGPFGVAAYSIVMYICSIFNMVLIGIVQGAQPLLSFNHGGKNEQNVRSVYRLALLSCLLMTALFYFLVLVFGTPLASLFAPGNTALIEQATSMMRIYFIGFFPIGISLVHILLFQSTEREASSILLAFLRCIGFVQLFLLLLPYFFGVAGLYWALFAGEACNCAVSILLYRRAFRARSHSSKGRLRA